jgi:hypothetical protein
VVAEAVVRRFLLVAGLVSVALAATAAVPAGAADECNGLRVCLPVSGPWVAVAQGGAAYELQCPRRGYVVGGTDVRLASRDIDVSFRGETGSPVGPGVTTRASVLFTAIPAGVTPTSFRPFIGCIPIRGGGSRSQTGVAATPPGGLRPTRPLQVVVVSRSVAPGVSVVVARCPAGARLVGGTHAVAFRVQAPPSSAALAGVRARRTLAAGAVVATVRVTGDAVGAHPEVQVRALCRSAP